MTLPDWRKMDLDAGILREMTLDPQHLVLWLPRGSEGALRHWERIGNLPGAPVVALQGLGATTATSVRASQRVRGFFGKLFGQRGQPQEQTWMLPGGGEAAQEGERQTDLLLVWSDDASATLDEARVRSCWPAGKTFQRLGKNLVLVAGLEAAALPEPSRPSPANTREEAERFLAAARQGGDPGRLVSALTDLGILYANNHEGSPAVALFQEALAAVGQDADRVAEAEVRGNLGLALLSDHREQALELLAQALSLARLAGDRYAEKLARWTARRRRSPPSTSTAEPSGSTHWPRTWRAPWATGSMRPSWYGRRPSNTLKWTSPSRRSPVDSWPWSS